MNSVTNSINDILRNKRLAFLAAWHPRAGNPEMRTLIPKDVARHIARNYITLESQSVESEDKVVLMDRLKQYPYVALTAVPKKIQDMSLFVPKMYNDDLEFIDFCDGKASLQTPTLSLATNVFDDGDAVHRKLLLICLVEENSEFYATIRSVEKRILHQLVMNANLLLRSLLTHYRSDNKYMLHFKVRQRDAEHIQVFERTSDGTKRLGCLSECNHLMLRGTKVRFILRQIRVWSNKNVASLCWSVAQVVIWKRHQGEVDFAKFIEEIL